VLAAALVAAASVAVLPGPAVADVAPYGLNDAAGFRNILPPGEAGTDNVTQLGAYQASSAVPAHWMDQYDMYNNLPFASPTLTHAQIPDYFKDATFGVRPNDVDTVESPRPGVTIVRDKSFGIPHIYGQTNDDVLFGEGYAGAEDRLFLMDVLRHVARAQLSSFVGGSAGNRMMDRTQWAIAPYTEADLQSQIDNAPRSYGARGSQLVEYLDEYTKGINAYIDAASMNPNLMPGEYAAFLQTPIHWTGTDVIAEASLIGGIFGKGGGAELRSAMTLQAFQGRFGDAAGRAAWSDFRSKDDPEAPTTVSKRFPYETNSPFSPRGLAIPDAGSVTFAPVAPPVPGSSSSTSAARTATPDRASIPNDGSIGSQLLRAMHSGPALASNWELVNAKHSRNGHSIGVLGPQVGYYVPQILMEEDIHGPNFDARGATFPGVNLMVQLGHGRDYAWSATTATSDNVDTFAEVLCQDDYHYTYKGQCLPMERLDRTNSWTPSGGNMAPPGSETLTAYRTVHGIVYARGMVRGQKVAFVSARTTYFHEADSSIGLFALNDPNLIKGPASFQQAASGINFAFNWSYVDASHIAYYLSGWYPQRADSTSPDFPVLGTGEYDWKGYDPSTHTLSVLPFEAHPNAIDPDYLVSWNNKQAPGWAAADDNYFYGPVFRSQMIERRIRDDIAGGKKMAIERLITAMDEPATTDVRMFALWPILKPVLGTPSDPQLRDAIAKLDAWYADGGHRRDLDKDGVDEHNDAIRIMDAWWPKLLQSEFGSALGGDAFSKLRSMIGFGAPNPGTPASDYPSFSVGWYGFVSKDLRDLLAPGSARKPARRCRRVRRAVRRNGRVVRRHGRIVYRTVTVCRHKAKRKRKGTKRRAATASAATSAAAKRRVAKRCQRVRRTVRRHGRLVRRTVTVCRKPKPGARPTPAAPAAVAGRYSRIYCGGGSLAACRAALLGALKDALAMTPAQIYGQGGPCASNPQASCYDRDRSTAASAVSTPKSYQFQNRPTFQQVAELTRTLSR
jgi:acyl-homoserine lactone acylase PvdQ